jgi:hypothetical protein
MLKRQMTYKFEQWVFMKNMYVKSGCVKEADSGVHFGCYIFKQNNNNLCNYK